MGQENVGLFYYLCDGANTLIRAWLALKIVDGMFAPKWVKKKMRFGWGIVFVLVVPMQLFNMAVFSSGILLIMIFTTTAASVLLYECSVMRVLWLNMLSLVGVTMVDFFIQTCAYLMLDRLGQKKDLLLSAGAARGCYLILYTIVLLWFGNVLKKWLSTKAQEVFRYQKQGTVFAFFLLPVLVYFQRIYLQMDSERLWNRWWIFWLGLTMAVLLLWLNMIRQKAEEEKRMQQLEIQMLDENYLALLQVYNEKSILIHDMQNHLRTILELFDDNQKEECRAYLVQITGEIQKKESLSWTNHKILDMVLNRKVQEAQEAKIKIKCRSDDLSGLALTSAEICAFFTNLLDNAIEASMKCPEDTERQIRIVCRRQGNLLVVSLSNPVENGEEDSEKQMLQTTKEDKTRHGFGMISVEKVIRDHHGYMKADITENQFQLIAYFNAFLDE